jgi:PAS domain S-box-containing protein
MLPAAIVTLDAAGRVVARSAAAAALLGVARGDELGAVLALPAGGPDALLDRRVEVAGRRPSGEALRAEVTVTSAEPDRFTVFVRDLGRLRVDELRGPEMERLLSDAEALAHVGSWAMDLPRGRAMWSDEMYRIHGHEPGTVTPGVELVLAHVHPEDHARVADLLRRVADRPEEVPPEGETIEYRTMRPDGSAREVRARGRVERDAAGRPLRWVGSGQDVTDQRLTERELQAHYAVGQALRDWESFEEGVIGLLRRLGTALDFAMGALWTCDAGQGVLRARAFWSAPGEEPGDFEREVRESTFRVGTGVPGRAWRSGQPLFAEDLSTDPRMDWRAAAVLLGLRSGLAFPAVGDDGTVAVLSFYGRDRRESNERLLRTLVGIGRELGRFLDRHRAHLEPRRLSARELEVLQLAADGNTGPQIAERLILSPATVKSHFEHVYEKLGVSDRAAAVAHALRTGLIA